MDFSRGLTCIQDSLYCQCTNIKQQFTDKYFRAIGIADKMKSVRLVQIFRPIKEANRTHSKGYVEDLSTQSGRKRCAKMAVLNLSVLPIMHAGVVTSGRRSNHAPERGYCHGTIRVSRICVPRYNLRCSNQGIRNPACSHQL